MKSPILARVRWRPMQWLIPFLLIVFLTNDIRYTYGAPQAQFRFSGPQRQQNPSISQTGQFRVIPDFDDFDEFEDIIVNNARQRGSGFRNAQASEGSSSFGVPLSATHPGVRQETMDAARAHFSAPVRAAHPSRRQETKQASSASFGVPLSATRSGAQETSHRANAHFGIPLSTAHAGADQQASQKESAHFGVPLSATRAGVDQQAPHTGSAHFGVPLSATRPGGRQETSQIANAHFDVADRTRSHFSPPTHKSNLNSGRFFITDDNISFENIDNSVEIMSLGRRFHPDGIPKRSDVTISSAPPSSIRTVISNPFIFTPDVVSAIRDISIEDDDDEAFIVLSPMVKAYNPSEHNERLSLSNDFLNQYNYVDVQGTTHWGYKTDDQYQEHQVHDSGTMQGKFGWTSPEGSEVKIRYIADEGGYRVLSSSGIYTKDDDEVLRLKKLHLAEHEKARVNHQNIKEERRRVSTRVPLPTEFGDTETTFPTSGSGGIVIIPDDDDFPLVPGRASGIPSGVGVPLPTLDDTNLKPELDVGVFIDSSSSAGFPLPMPTQEGSSGFGVPLPDPTTGLVADTPSRASGHEFGVPLPDFTSTFGDAPSIPASGQEFGVSLPDPTLTFGSGQPSMPSVDQGVGVSLPDPTQTFGIDTPTVPASGQEFGVPLPDPTLTFGSGQPSVPTVDQGGVPLSDPTLSGDQETGVPLSTIESGFREPSATLADREVGVPLSDSRLPKPSLADQGVGVPLPDPTFGFEGTAISTGQHDGVSIPDFATGVGSSRPGEQGVGASIPDLSFSGDQGSGVPLPDFTPTFGFGESSISPANEGFGVSLPDQTLGFEHGQPSTSFVDPTASVPSRSSTDQGLVDPHSATATGGVPLSGPTETFETSKPSFTSPDQGLKVTLLDSQGTFGSSVLDSTSDKEFGVPLFGTSFGIDSSSFDTASQPAEASPPHQEFGIPLAAPNLFGEIPSSPTDHGLTSPSVDPSITDTASKPAETVPAEEFGIPLITPEDIFGAIPLLPSDQVSPSPTVESVPSRSEQFGGFKPETPSHPKTTGTHSDSHPSSFGVPLFPVDAFPPSVSHPEFTGTHFDPNQGSFGVPSFQDVITPSAGVGIDSPTTIDRNEISSFGVPLDHGFPQSASPDASAKPSSFGESAFKTPSPTLIDRTDTQRQPAPQPGFQDTFGVPLDFNPSITPVEIRPGQSGNFFLFPDNDFAGFPQGTGVSLGEGATNTLQTVDGPTFQGGQEFGHQPSVGVPLSPAIFAGGDFLQGPPVEQLDPSLVRDGTELLSTQGLDPCQNSKIHPTLLPPECATRKSETVEPSQNIGKSLLSSSSKREPSQDSFIVVVNSDIFQ